MPRMQSTMSPRGNLPRESCSKEEHTVKHDHANMPGMSAEDHANMPGMDKTAKKTEQPKPATPAPTPDAKAPDASKPTDKSGSPPAAGKT